MRGSIRQLRARSGARQGTAYGLVPNPMLFYGLIVIFFTLFGLGIWVLRPGARASADEAGARPDQPTVISQLTVTPTPPEVYVVQRRAPTRTPTSSPTPTITNTPTITGTGTPTFTPTITLTPTITMTVHLTETHTPTLTATPTATPIPKGVIQASYGDGAIVRLQPTTASDQIAFLPVGAQVEVMEIVSGEAIDSIERRWYRVRFDGRAGYIYFKLVALK